MIKVVSDCKTTALVPAVCFELGSEALFI